MECRARSNGGGSSASEVKRVRVFLRDFGLAASTDERVESAERTGCGALRDEERVLVQARESFPCVLNGARPFRGMQQAFSPVVQLLAENLQLDRACLCEARRVEKLSM